MSELNIPKLPPQITELLEDPRLEGLADPLPNFPPEERLLSPANPPAVGDSPFLLMSESADRHGGRVTWVNRPEDPAYREAGEGRGLEAFRNHPPRFEEHGKKPKKSPDLWTYLSWFVASPRVVDILSRFDPSVIDTVKIDWAFSDGQKLDGYVFLDVRRLIHAYDYKRTAVVIGRNRGRKYLDRLAFPRALNQISDPSVHVFRDAYHRTDVFMSRALARELSVAGIQGIYFQDPAAIGAVRFK